MPQDINFFVKQAIGDLVLNNANLAAQVAALTARLAALEPQEKPIRLAGRDKTASPDHGK